MRVRVAAFVKRAAATLGLGVVALSGCSRGPGGLDQGVSGFRHPESVLHDPVGDVYLVSNINENPRAKDANGFISRVAPDGRNLELRWIEGGRDGVELHAPKGMALSGDRLYVADLDAVRMFDRATGAPRGTLHPPGALALNGLAAAPDGSVYATDTAWGADSDASTGADAIFVILPDDTVRTLCRGPSLGQPNGIVVDATGVYIASWRDAAVLRVGADCAVTPVARFTASGLDGLVRLPGGDFLVSSWHGRSVWRVVDAGSPAPDVRTQFSHRAVPGIGYDVARTRLLVPFYETGEVGFQEGVR